MNMNAILPILSAAATYGPSLMRYSKHVKPVTKGAIKMLKFVKKNPKQVKKYASAAGKIFNTAGQLISMSRGSKNSSNAVMQHAPPRPVPATTYAPVYTGALGREQVMQAEEFVGSVDWYPASSNYTTTLTAGAIECLPVNPIYWAGTRVNTAIRNYQTWKVNRMSLEFVPTLGSNWAGTVALAMMPQDHAIPADMDPVSLATSLSALPGFKTCPIQSVGVPSSQRQVSASSVLCCVSNPDPISNPVLSIVVTDLVGPDGDAPSAKMSIGKLLVKYTVTMREPCPAWGLSCGITETRIQRSNANVLTIMDTSGNTANSGSLQPDFIRVCRSWNFGGTTVAPTWESTEVIRSGIMPGNLVIHDAQAFTSPDMGGWAVFSGTPLAAINRRIWATGITLNDRATPPVSSTRTVYTNDLRLTDRRTGVDISSVLTDSTYPFVPATAGQYSLYTGFRACILPSYSRNLADIDGPVPSSTSLGSLAFTTALTTTDDPEATVVTTTTLPQPMYESAAPVARASLRLPQIRGQPSS
jgi:hypothetical protein